MNKTACSLIAASLLLSSTAAMAQAINVEGLTPAQIAELQLQAETAKANKPVTPVEIVNEWAEIGTGIGTGLAAAARETGTVVNEFAETPVGQITTAVIVWKVVGKDILGVIVGILLCIAYSTLWIVYTNKFFTPPWKYEYDKEGKVTRKGRDLDGMPFSAGDMSFFWPASWTALVLVNGFIVGVVIF